METIAEAVMSWHPFWQMLAGFAFFALYTGVMVNLAIIAFRRPVEFAVAGLVRYLGCPVVAVFSRSFRDEYQEVKRMPFAQFRLRLFR